MIDYLSDTVTLPTQAMRDAMYRAEVGDDVYGEDPTVNRLEAKAAAMLGKEAACFMPSGTMANLTAILSHCRRGFEVLVGDESDLYNYEAGGPSVVGGVVFHPIATDERGRLKIEDLRRAVRDPFDYQCARAGLICIENPHCRRGGRPLPLDYLEELQAFAQEQKLPIHMDGARIFNAALALKVPPARLAAYADSIQFCLSKNLAAPVGSMVVGDKTLVEDCRRYRKMLGGGMRQVGVIAAAGLVALEQMVDRLDEDHRRARLLAEGIHEIKGLAINLDEVETNMVFFRISNPNLSLPDFLERLEAQGVRMGELGHGRIRAVIHYAITDSEIQTTLAAIKQIMENL